MPAHRRPVPRSTMLQILIRLVLLFFLWSLIRIVIRAFSGVTGDGGAWSRQAGSRRGGGYGGGFRGSTGSRTRSWRAPGSRVRRRREALDVLGLSEGATDADVKRSYRDLARKYHPDRVASKAPELSDLASEKFREIREAYEYLMAHGTGRAG